MSGKDVKADRQTGRPRRTSRRRWWCIGVVVLLAAFHVPLLQALGRGLTIRDSGNGCDVVLLLGGDHRVQVAADLVASGEVEQIWLIEGRPNYLVATGILPPGAQVVTDELLARGVAPEQIIVHSDHTVDDLADAIEQLGRQLKAAPDSEVLVTCGELGGRYVRLVLDEMLDDPTAGRVHILGLPEDDFDAEWWWRSRTGLKRVFGEFCRIAFVLVAGPDQETVPEVDPDAIENRLQRRFGEAACFEH